MKALQHHYILLFDTCSLSGSFAMDLTSGIEIAGLEITGEVFGQILRSLCFVHQQKSPQLRSPHHLLM